MAHQPRSEGTSQTMFGNGVKYVSVRRHWNQLFEDRILAVVTVQASFLVERRHVEPIAYYLDGKLGDT